MTNDNYNDRSEYSRIAWTKVREGDVLLHKNGDRLTVTLSDFEKELSLLRVGGVWWRAANLVAAGFAPYRKVEPVPTTPGAYLDKDGDVWVLDSEDSYGAYWVGVGSPAWLTPSDVEHFAPFTRLVPMPTEEQIVEVLDSALDTPRGMEELAAAVMALLGGGNNA